MVDKIAVFIPAYNCENQIGRVLSQFTPEVQSLLAHIRVVDNGSKDATLTKAIEGARHINQVPITVVKNENNYNLGGTIKMSLEWASKDGFDYLICLHGDDQPDIRDLVKPLKEGQHRDVALLVGARFHPQSKIMGYQLIRILGNRFFNLLCTVIFRRRIYDLIAGLNVFRVKDFRSKFWSQFPNDLTFDVHVLFYCMKNNLPIRFVPISWREEDQVSNAKTIKQGLRILKLVGYYIFSPKNIFATKYPTAENMTYKISYASPHIEDNARN